MCQGKKSYRLDDIPENILEEMTREKRSTDSIEKEPDFIGFGGKSLVKTSIVNINDIWRGKKIRSQIRLKKKHWFWTIVITKKPINAFIPCLIWNYSIKIIKLQKWYVDTIRGKLLVSLHQIWLKSIHFVNSSAQGSCFHKLTADVSSG